MAEAHPHKASIAVASDLAGLLEGSSRVNPRRDGVGFLHELSTVPQVHVRHPGALTVAREAR